MEVVATPTEIKLWPVALGSVGMLLAAGGLLIGVPVAAARFDDPSRLLWLVMMPVLVAIAALGLIRQPVRVIVSDGGIELRWLRRTREIDASDVVGIVTPKRPYFLGDGVLVMLNDGTKVEVPNSEGRVLMALRHHFPDVPITRSDSGYLSA